MGSSYLMSQGGIGQVETGGASGAGGTAGSGGSGGSGGTDRSTTAWPAPGKAGPGGNGNTGGPGGVGGQGGTGGAGGGGSGGTVRLVGSVLDASAATVNVSGGPAVFGGLAGGGGIFAALSNASGGAPAVMGAATLLTLPSNQGSKDGDPFVKTKLSVPLIPDLYGGAESYGLLPNDGGTPPLDALEMADPNVRAVATGTAAPSDALVAVVREHVPQGFSGFADFGGYDFVLLINLTNQTLANPALGLVPGSADATLMRPLAVGGLAISANFGGSGGGARTVTGLEPHGVWVTLVPAGQTVYANASVGPAGAAVPLINQALNPLSGGVTYSDLYVEARHGQQTVGLPLTGLQALAVSPDGHSTYGLNVARNVVVAANADLSQRQTLAVAGLTGASAAAVSPDGRNVYVTEPGLNQVAVFSRDNSGNLTALPTIATGSGPGGAIAINGAGTQLVVGGPGGVESFQRNADGTLSSGVTASVGAVSGLAFSTDGAGSLLYVAGGTANTLTVLSASNLNVVQTLHSTDKYLGSLQNARGIAVSPDDAYVYVIGEGGAALIVLANNVGGGANTLTWKQSLRAANGVRGLLDADGVACSPDGQYVYVTGGQGDSLAVFQRQPDGTLALAQVLRGTLGLNDPAGVAVDGTGTVYVASQLGLGVRGGGLAKFTLPPGDVQPPPRTFTAFDDGAMEGITVTLGDAPDVLSEVHAPSAAAFTVDAGNGADLLNLLDVPGPAPQPAQTLTVNAGDGGNQVTVFAGRPGDTIRVTTGAGADVVQLTGDPKNSANDQIAMHLGAGNDTAQVSEATLDPSAAVSIDGGADFDTLLFDAAGQAITAYDASGNVIANGQPATPDGALQTGGRPKVTYTSVEAIPGFVGSSATVTANNVSEGKPLSLIGKVTPATNTRVTAISWDLNGDGVFADAADPNLVLPSAGPVTTNPAVSWGALEALGITLPGTYTIAMQVTSDNNTATTVYTTFQVLAVPPTVVLSGAPAAYVGEPYRLGVATSYAGGEQLGHYTISWGDGTTDTWPSDASARPDGASPATHTYAATGGYAIQVTVSPDNGFARPVGGTLSVNVGVDANSLGAGGPYTINAGDNLTLTATADGDPTQAQWDLLALGTYADASAPFVSNGDGTATSTVTLTWAQLEALGITDSGTFPNGTVKALYPTADIAAGYLTSAPTTLTVNDVAPTATLGGSAREGGSGDVTFRNVFHPSAAQTGQGFLYSYDVGNTGTFQVVNSTSPSCAIPPADLLRAGPLVVRGRIADRHGAFSDYIVTVPVANQPPAILTTDADKTVNENAVVALNNVTFSDPGEDVITASIDWGDGSTSQGIVTPTNPAPAPTTGTVSGSHAYAYRPAPYTATVTVQDADGATASASFRVTVLDPPVSVVAGPDQAVNEGDVVRLTAALFDDPGAPRSYSATVNWGDGTPADTHPTVSAPATAADDGRVLDSHAYGQPGVYTVTVSVTKGNQPAVSSTFTVTVADVAPAVHAGPDVAAGEGVPVSGNATFSDPGFPVGGAAETYNATIAWGDGTTGSGTVSVTAGGPGVRTTGTVTGSHQYRGDGPYTVTVTVADGNGGSGGDTFTVTDAPPVVTPGPDLSGREGSPLSLSATFSDLGFDYGTPKSFAALIDWGDGTSSPGTVSWTPGKVGVPTTGTVTGTHVYATFGTFPVTVRLSDEAGAAGSTTLQAVVSDVAPTLAPIPDLWYVAGQALLLSATFDDAGKGDTHTATIDWGDGTVVTVGTESAFVNPDGTKQPLVVEPTATAPGRLTIGHLYTDYQPHTVTVAVTDNGGLTASLTAPARPEVRAKGGFTVQATEGSPSAVQTVATFTDPAGAQPASAYGATITWGDGQSSAETISYANGVFTVQGGHSYAEEGTYPVGVAITHGSSPTVSVTSTATVADPAVVAAGGFTVQAKKALASVPQAVATFTDPAGPGPLSDYGATIAWGDGTTSAGAISLAGTFFTVTGTHAYSFKGSYPVTVTLTHDRAPAVSVTSTAVVVANVGVLLLDRSGSGALTLNGSGALTVGGIEAVAVNSGSATAVVVSGNGGASAEEFDIVGAQASGLGGLQGEVDTRAAAAPDPLAALPAPAAPAPAFAAVSASGRAALTLQPGTYVGGISVSGQAQVTLQPGVYYLQGGGLSVSGQAALTGNGVLIYNAPQGSGDGITVGGQASVSLTAMSGGPYQGVALFQARGSAAPISVSGSVSLAGTVYAAGAAVSVAGNGALAVLGNSTSALARQLIAADLQISGNGSASVGQAVAVQSGQSATAAFWDGTAGQQLIGRFNGGGASTALSSWLATNFANLYGSAAGAGDLSGLTNGQVAAYFQRLYAAGNQSLGVQVLTTALNVYATTSALGGNAAVAYGFLVTYGGLGSSVAGVGANGAPFGVANNSSVAVIRLLRAANNKARRGAFYAGDATLIAEADLVFTAINQAGGID